jgi:hypothetical protein
MRRGDASANLPKEDLLKIDKDCFVDPQLNRDYVRTVIEICSKHGISVQWIKSTLTRHGRHFYIKIHRPVKALKTNDLQYLLGDDPKRVAFNKARIKSGLPEWNKLFERIRAPLTTIYCRPVFSGTHRHHRRR